MTLGKFERYKITGNGVNTVLDGSFMPREVLPLSKRSVSVSRGYGYTQQYARTDRKPDPGVIELTGQIGGDSRDWAWQASTEAQVKALLRQLDADLRAGAQLEREGENPAPYTDAWAHGTPAGEDSNVMNVTITIVPAQVYQPAAVTPQNVDTGVY